MVNEEWAFLKKLINLKEINRGEIRWDREKLNIKM